MTIGDRSPIGVRSPIRFSGGTGPALLGVPAHEVRDQTADLDQLWPSGDVRRLVEQVAANPATLETWVLPPPDRSPLRYTGYGRGLVRVSDLSLAHCLPSRPRRHSTVNAGPGRPAPERCVPHPGRRVAAGGIVTGTPAHRGN